MEEVFKDIPGYEGLYQVSNLGRVKSLPKELCNHLGCHISKEKILTPRPINGYFLVALCNNNKRKDIYIHQLVAMSFLNHKPCKYKLVVDHINNNPSDNRVENLQVVTHRYNTYKTQGKYVSKYKGVCWDKQRNKWMSKIYINGKHLFLGRFNCELKAALVYQNKLKETLC
jgi:hypothetical protein